MDGGQDEGEGAAAKQGGHQGGLGDVARGDGESNEGDEEKKKSRRRMGRRHQESQDVDNSEKAGSDQDPVLPG